MKNEVEIRKINLVLQVLEDMESILSKRDKSFYSSDDSVMADVHIGLRGLYRYFIYERGLEKVLGTRIETMIPEFNPEYVSKIVPLKLVPNFGYWWPINEYWTSKMKRYDVTSRLKVVRHFIKLYKNRLKTLVNQ